MKTTDPSVSNNNSKYLIHLTFAILLVSLSVIVPVVNSTVSVIPYWAILVLFLVPFAIYMSLVFFIHSRQRRGATTNVPVAGMEHDQDEITGLQQPIAVAEEQQDDDGDNDDDEGVPSSIDNTSYYNPSTVGIPPSSFLAPTIQASIRSSSLDYTPPPPAYQDMMYPPSYRSTHSAKDDNVSVVY